MAINPLNLSLCDPWEEMDKTSNSQTGTWPQVIFKLQPHYYALITMDLRHIFGQVYNWVYGDDWAISITVGENLTFKSPIDAYMMPE
jgi:hypothetical protein